MGRLKVLAWLSFALALAVGGAQAQPPPDCADGDVQIHVRVHGIRSAHGVITLVLYGDNPADFLGRGKRIARARVPASVGMAVACLVAPRPGRYALAFYHDEDGDGRFSRNLVGLPTEGYGFSRDAPAMFGLPDFADVVFTAGAGSTTLEATMRY